MSAVLRLKAVLRELQGRRGDQAIAALGTAAASYESDIQQLAREMLLKNLSREGVSVIKNKLKDDRAEVRIAAAQVAASKSFRLEAELIDLLDDEVDRVRQAAHEALVKLSAGVDHGPSRNASPAERDEAIRKWRAWAENKETRR